MIAAESDESLGLGLGLETKSTETLGLVSDSYIIQRLVSSRSRLGGNILSQSHLGLVSETKY